MISQQFDLLAAHALDLFTGAVIPVDGDFRSSIGFQNVNGHIPTMT